jgi:glycosyltransferase involved in cell wall biosynthesis
MAKSILFITTTSLSANPRILKEIMLAGNNGFEVSFIAFMLDNWSDATDRSYVQNFVGVKAKYLSATKKPLLNWLLSTLVWKGSQWIGRIMPNLLLVNAYAHNKRSFLIYNELKKHTCQYNLVIAHNLGALFPAMCFAKKHQIPFAFDVEDYHPGETCSPAEKKRREFLMQKLLPHAAYISYASPLIGEHMLKLLKSDKIPHHFLVNNCFSEKEFELTENKPEKVEFVWFSQNIAAGRGLELVVPALYKYKDKVKLVLIGNLYEQFFTDYLSAYADMLHIQEPLPQSDLNRMVCRFDVGLAIEITTTDLNKDIALSNKIFTYAQAGLFILATNTAAQQQFMKEHPVLGHVSEQSPAEMEKAIGYLLENTDKIRNEKKTRFAYAKKLGWENENGKLVQVWRKLLTIQ